MSVTISSIVTNLNTYIGDSTTDRVSSSERYQAITEATAWLLEELGNEHMVDTYDLDYLDTVNYYKVTTGLPDLLTGGDLRRQDDNYFSFTRKSPRELSEEIAQKVKEPSWAIERRDGNSYLVVNVDAKNPSILISNFESLTDGGGTWEVAASSDTINLEVDYSEKREGSASLSFDADVSVSGNNTIGIRNTSVSSKDFTKYKSNSSFIFDLYIPDVTEITSVELEWGSSSSNFWFSTVTTAMDGNAFVNGWNVIKIDWKDATSFSGTPDKTDCSYFAINVNYSASQTDSAGFRVDNLRVSKPEKLIFHYISWNVGQVSSSNDTAITAFTADTNVPFFSDRYDQYKYAVAQKAASILFSTLRLRQEAIDYEGRAVDSLSRFKKNFESSKTREVKSFKIMGNNLRRRNRSGRIR